MYITRLKMRMPQSLRFFRPRWMQLSPAHLGHTLHCNTKPPSWCFGCFGCLCKQPSENDVSHGLGCTREQRMQRIPDYKTLGKKTALCEVKVLLKQGNKITQAFCPFRHPWLKLQRTCPCTWQQQRPPPLPWLRKLRLLLTEIFHIFLAILILFLSTSAFQISFQFHIHIPQRRQ